MKFIISEHIIDCRRLDLKSFKKVPPVISGENKCDLSFNRLRVLESIHGRFNQVCNSPWSTTNLVDYILYVWIIVNMAHALQCIEILICLFDMFFLKIRLLIDWSTLRQFVDWEYVTWMNISSNWSIWSQIFWHLKMLADERKLPPHISLFLSEKDNGKCEDDECILICIVG